MNRRVEYRGKVRSKMYDMENVNGVPYILVKQEVKNWCVKEEWVILDKFLEANAPSEARSDYVNKARKFYYILEAIYLSLKDVKKDDKSKYNSIFNYLEDLRDIFHFVCGRAYDPVLHSKEKYWKPEDCHKESEGCFCATGFAYEDLCVVCRDRRWPVDIQSRCVCPPDDNK